MGSKILFHNMIILYFGIIEIHLLTLFTYVLNRPIYATLAMTLLKLCIHRCFPRAYVLTTNYDHEHEKKTPCN